MFQQRFLFGEVGWLGDNKDMLMYREWLGEGFSVEPYSQIVESSEYFNSTELWRIFSAFVLYSVAGTSVILPAFLSLAKDRATFSL